jgi:hypothetical protein
MAALTGAKDGEDGYVNFADAIDYAVLPHNAFSYAANSALGTNEWETGKVSNAVTNGL